MRLLIILFLVCLPSNANAMSCNDLRFDLSQFSLRYEYLICINANCKDSMDKCTPYLHRFCEIMVMKYAQDIFEKMKKKKCPEQSVPKEYSE